MSRLSCALNIFEQFFCNIPKNSEEGKSPSRLQESHAEWMKNLNSEAKQALIERNTNHETYVAVFSRSNCRKQLMLTSKKPLATQV